MDEYKFCSTAYLTGKILKVKDGSKDRHYMLSEDVVEIIQKRVVATDVCYILRKHSDDENYDLDAIFDLESGKLYPLRTADNGDVKDIWEKSDKEYAQRRYMKLLFKRAIFAEGA